MQVTPKEAAAFNQIAQALTESRPESFTFSFTRRTSCDEAPVTFTGAIQYTEEESDDGTQYRVPLLSVIRSEQSRLTIDPRKPLEGLTTTPVRD